MSSEQIESGSVDVSIENIGGIDEASASFDPGVTVLPGRNATNRTSFLRAVMAALGSEKVSLKGDAEEGRVELRIDGEAYTRRLTCRGDDVVFAGDPYLEDPEVADLFAFLLETNEARQAIAYGGDLRDLIMRPVDTEAINAEIKRLESERRDVEDELEELEDLARRLPTLEERRQDLEAEIEEKRESLAEIRSAIEAADADIEEKRAERSGVESTLGDLKDVRSELETVRSRIDSQRESVDALEDQREELEDELESMDSVDGNVEALEEELQRVRDHTRRLDSDLGDLQNVIQFNEGALEGGNHEVLHALGGNEANGSLTDQLLGSEQTVCWTCGTTVDVGQIEETVDRLRELRQSKFDDRRELEQRLEELKEEKDAIQTRRDRRRSLEQQLADVDAELESRTEQLARLEDERAELEQRVHALESDVEALEDESGDFSELRELHRNAAEVEVRIESLESDREDVEREIASIDERLDARDRHEARMADIQEEITELRTRIERLEEQTVEEFNRHMDELLTALEYDNLDRIWIERKERDVRDGRQTVRRSVFELHVVRTAADGVTYEDAVEHLSESEREVTGLVFALAGYLAHEVYESLPFILLDSLEAIDADRISMLVDYFERYAEHLLVALLPGDASALDGEFLRLTVG